MDWQHLRVLGPLLAAAWTLHAVPCLPQEEPGVSRAGPRDPAVVELVANSADGLPHGLSAAFHVGDGLFVTAYHCFLRYDRFELIAADGSRVPVTDVCAADRALDVVVCRAGAPLPGLGVLECSRTIPGNADVVTWHGFPEYSYAQATVRVLGHWSVRDWGSLLVLDDQVKPGTSGGPILDSSGRVVGMIRGGKILPGDGPEPGSWTHAVSVVDIARVVASARHAAAAGQDARGPVPLATWLDGARDPVGAIAEELHRCRARQDYQKCLATLRARLEECPRDARSWSFLANVHRALGMQEEASNDMLVALALDPSDPEVSLEFGQLLESRGQVLAAIVAYERCSGVVRRGLTYYELSTIGNADAHRARLLHGLGRPEEALEALRGAVGVFPYHASDRWRMGDCFLATGRRQQAIASYQESLDLRPGQPRVLLRLAIAHLESGDLPRALEAARKSVESDDSCELGRFVKGYLESRADTKDDERVQWAALQGLGAALRGRLIGHMKSGQGPGPKFSMNWDGSIVLRAE